MRHLLFSHASDPITVLGCPARQRRSTAMVRSTGRACAPFARAGCRHPRRRATSASDRLG